MESIDWMMEEGGFATVKKDPFATCWRETTTLHSDWSLHADFWGDGGENVENGCDNDVVNAREVNDW